MKKGNIANKKILTGLLFFAVVLVGLTACIPAVAAQSVVSIQNATADPGQTVTVPINITGVTNLATADIWLSYNKDVVIVENVTKGNLGDITVGIDNTAGVTKMNWFSATGKTGDFVFAYVALKAVGSAGQTSVLDLEVKELTDTGANPITHTVEDGVFKILTPDTTPPDTKIVSGPTGTITYNDVTFTWSGSDDVTPTAQLVYSYKLEGHDTSWSAWTSATSKSYADLPNGAYTFKVKAKDLALNEDPTPASSSFTVSVTVYAPGGGGRVADSDGDGWSDSYEIRMGTDPNDPNSYPAAPAPTPSPTPTPTPTTTPTATPTPTPTPTANTHTYANTTMLRSGIRKLFCSASPERAYFTKNTSFFLLFPQLLHH